jgi:alpha-beta hydrolase superfamily lysophospholipase
MRTQIFFLALAIICAGCQKVEKMRTRHIAEEELFEPVKTTLRPETSTRRNIEVQLDDGNILRGIVLRVANPKANVIYFGGSREIAQGATERLMDWSARHNINAICIDYRGYGASSGQSAIKHFFGDALQIYDRTQKVRGDIPTFALGFSIGSLPATYLAANRPVQGLILVAPIPSLLDQTMYPKKKWRQRMRDDGPWYFAPLSPLIKYARDYDIPENSEPIHQILNVTAPLLLMHAERDEAVPPASSKKVYELAPGYKSLLVLPNIQHERLPLLDTTGGLFFSRFLDECLGLGDDSSATVIIEVIDAGAQDNTVSGAEKN